MSARALASANLSFGLVSIPVKLYSTGEAASAVRFNMLHQKCGSRLKQQFFCPQDNEVVPRTETVKGFEFAKGQYVMFSAEELKALEETPTQSVDITEFLPTTKIDPIYFEKSYYLGPDKGGDRAYKLLAQALEKSGRSALAKYAARGKQYLVLVRPSDGALIMQQLRYADELRPVSEVPLGDAKVNKTELELALQIIEQGVAENFRPEQYEDEVRKRILNKIERKVQGQEITVEPAEEPKAQVIDLMQALKSSLAKKAQERKPAKRAAAKRTTKAAARKTAGRKKS